jgi:hypothetical protein
MGLWKIPCEVGRSASARYAAMLLKTSTNSMRDKRIINFMERLLKKSIDKRSTVIDLRMYDCILIIGILSDLEIPVALQKPRRLCRRGFVDSGCQRQCPL